MMKKWLAALLALAILTAPALAEALEDGVYSIEVESSSSMFRIESCELRVEDGAMRAVMTMGGKGYLYVFMGTAEEAEAAGESAYIPFEEQADGTHAFTVPVAALEEKIDCAAYSKKKERWYDRELVFHAPAGTASSEGVTAEALALADGEYTVEVALTGGSGKARVTSPARLTVADGVCTALIEWSSSNYDYMKVDGEQFFPVNEQGNSAFEIPVRAFDCLLDVLADTTAMSVPHEIEYVLTFDSATIAEARP